MRIVAISGSLRAHSSNTLLLHAIADLAPDGLEIEIGAPLDRLPHFNADLDGDDPPTTVRAWRAELTAADAVLFCSPEYGHGIPGVLKNSLDWLVSSGELHHKPVAVVNATPHHGGGLKAQASLVQTLQAIDAIVVEGGCISVPAVRQKLDAEGGVTDPDTARELRACLEALASAVEAKS